MKSLFPPIRGIALVGIALTIACPVFSVTAAVTPPEADPAKPASASRPNEAGADDYTQDIRVLGEIARRKAALDRRERDLELRESQVSAAETLARRELAQLSSLRGEVEKIVNEQTEDAGADQVMLAGLFSNMKPQQAAAIMGKLEIPKAAAILRRLETRMAGPVLAAMDPGIAAAIARELERAHAPFLDAAASSTAPSASATQSASAADDGRQLQ
jgi:flagellar motility protein MotE (MotC chaperone)